MRRSGDRGRRCAVATGMTRGFTPTALSGTVLWLPPDPAAITVATGISGWLDSSTANNDFAQGTSGRQPADAGGYPDGDGSDDCLTCASTIASGAQTVSFLFKLDAIPGASAFQVLLSYKTGASAWFEVLCMNFAGYQNFSFKFEPNTTQAASVGFNPTLDTEWHRCTITYDGGSATSAASYTALYDGVAQTVVASGDFGRVSGSTGALLARDANGTPQSAFNGKLKALHVANRVLSSSESAQIDTHLAGL